MMKVDQSQRKTRTYRPRNWKPALKSSDGNVSKGVTWCLLPDISIMVFVNESACGRTARAVGRRTEASASRGAPLRPDH